SDRETLVGACTHSSRSDVASTGGLFRLFLAVGFGDLGQAFAGLNLIQAVGQFLGGLRVPIGGTQLQALFFHSGFVLGEVPVLVGEVKNLLRGLGRGQVKLREQTELSVGRVREPR